MKKKVLTLLMAMVMAVGVCGTSFAAAAKTVSFIDMRAVMNNYPGIVEIAKQIADKQATLQNDFNTKAKNLDAKGQQELQAKYNQQLSDFENKKMKPVREKINAALNKVMAAQGVDSVVDISVMVAGGNDLTDDVVKEIQK